MQTSQLLRAAGALPLAGILAGLAVFAADRAVPTSKTLWQAVSPRVQEHALERGIAADRLATHRARSSPRDSPHAVVVGSSRANAGFTLDKLPEAGRGSFVASTLAHAGIGPFEIRSSVGDVLDMRPDVVVLVLSEFDLNRSLHARRNAHFGSLSAVGDLIRHAGVVYAVENRVNLYRLTLGCVLNLYRYRLVFHRAFIDNLRRFPLDERFVEEERPSADPEASAAAPGSPLRWFLGLLGQSALQEGDPRRLAPRERRAVLRRLQEEFFGYSVRGSLNQVLSITRGDHSRVNQALVREAVERFAEAGVKVLIAEAPLHPAAAEFYDASIRDEFLAFAESLERDFGARLLPLEASGPYQAADFSDLTHLGRITEGPAKLTGAIVAAVSEMLGTEPETPSGI